MREARREPSTRARVLQELLGTPAVQELIRARAGAEPGRIGALEAAVRADPELIMGLAVSTVDRINDTARTVTALAALVAGMPAPFVREVMKRAWARTDGDAFRQACSSLSSFLESEAFDRDATAGWLSARLEAAFSSAPDARWLETSTRLLIGAYARVLHRDPRILYSTVETALGEVEPAVLEHVVDSTLDQAAEVLASRPYLLRSLGRFALRLARGSVRATLRH